MFRGHLGLPSTMRSTSSAAASSLPPSPARSTIRYVNTGYRVGRAEGVGDSSFALSVPDMA
eukprot:2560366-Rhodomonas_salina.1